MRVEPRYRKKLDEKHIALLKALYKFRFGTSDLLASSQGKKSGSQVYKRLRTLLEQEYVGRRYEAEYRLRGQSASYFLLAKGLRVLRDLPEGEFNPKVLHNIHRDKSAADQFIEQNLAVFDVYTHFKTFYGDRLEFYTKSDLIGREGFPKALPDVYVLLDNRPFFLESFLDIEPISTAVSLATRKIKQYAEFASGGAWTSTPDMPGLFCVCETDNLQGRLQKRFANLPEAAEICIYVTAKDALARVSEDERVWYAPSEPNTTFHIHELLTGAA